MVPPPSDRASERARDIEDWSRNRLLIIHRLNEIEASLELISENITQIREQSFSEEEREAVKKLLVDVDRYRVAWGIIGRLTVYVAGAVAAIWGIRELLPKIWEAVKLVAKP